MFDFVVVQRIKNPADLDLRDFLCVHLFFLRNKTGTMTIITRTKPMITMPSVEPTSDTLSAGWSGVLICIEREAVLKFFGESVG